LNRLSEIIADMPTMSQTAAPPGYLELCARLQVERNPVTFNLLIETINRLLREYERCNADEDSTVRQPHAPSVEALIAA
jgi:hypothetical protein